MLISIIVPVYNVESWVKRCYQSLINQTFDDYEIILVNDGSTDKSGSICKNLAENNKKTFYYEKENGGLSDARNFGLRKAKGDYILFVDSDDSINLDTCEQFSRLITDELDIICGNAKVIDEKNSITTMQHKNQSNEILSGKEVLKRELDSDTMYIAAWLNLYRREYLVSNNLEFKKSRLHEDEEFTPRVFLKAEKVIVSNIYFYNYYLREGSISKNKNMTKNAIDLFNSLHELEYLYQDIIDKDLKDKLLNSLVDKYMNMIQIAKLIDKKNNDIIDYEFLKRNAKSKRNRFKVMLFSLNKHLYYHINKAIK